MSTLLWTNLETTSDSFSVGNIRGMYAFEVTKIYGMASIWFLSMDYGEKAEKQSQDCIFTWII